MKTTNLNLKDCEKFKIMIKVYEDIYISAKSFSQKIGVGKSTVFKWLKDEEILQKVLHGYDDNQHEKDKEFDISKIPECSFNTKSKTKICKAFRLLDTVWSDIPSTKESFEEKLLKNKKIEKSTEIRGEHIETGLPQENTKDKNMNVNHLSKDEIDLLLDSKLEKESASFMFEFAKKLKNKKQIEDALKVLQWIEERESTFRYTYENELRHFRAILLSHDKVKDWDGAIHILRSLYHSRQYHLEEPEILTLLASNYKRKALDGHNSKDEIDMQLITSALCLYEDAYNLKPDNAKYYDAINITYLYNIVDAIEVEYADKVEIETLYKNLSQIWRIDTSNWWEVCSDAEFLMLLGKVDLAILKMNEFLDSHKVEPFEIDATVRQLKLYIKFSEDENAVKFLRYLVESWEEIRK